MIRKHWFLFLLLVSAAAGAAAWYLWPGFSYGVLVGAERVRSGVIRADTTIDGVPIAYLEAGMATWSCCCTGSPRAKTTGPVSPGS